MRSAINAIAGYFYWLNQPTILIYHFNIYI